MRNALIIGVAIVLMTAAVQASEVKYSPLAFNCLDASGNAIADGTYVMVLDLNGNGFQGTGYTSQAAGATDNASAWKWDAGDMVMDRGQILGGMAFPVSVFDTTIAGYDVNVDHYFLLTFDLPYSDSAAGPGLGVHYGAEDMGTVGAPGEYTPFPDGGSANLTTVPEPVSMLVLLVGGGLLAARRRMGRNA